MSRASDRFRLKRVYAPPAPEDGLRVLVDRLWPRGLPKAKAHVDLWLKAIAPSDALRRQLHADPRPPEARWDEFCDAYARELEARAGAHGRPRADGKGGGRPGHPALRRRRTRPTTTPCPEGLAGAHIP